MATTRGRGSLRVAWESFTQNLIPLLDNIKSLGSSNKRWAAIYAVAAVFTSLIIGSVLLSSQAGELWTNASFNVNGSAYVRNDLNVTGLYYGNGSQLTGMFGGNTTAEIFNVVDNSTFVKLPRQFNSTDDMFNAVDNSTFVKLPRQFNTTDQMFNAVNNGSFIDLNKTIYVDDNAGSVSIGSATQNNASILFLDSTTMGFHFPTMTINQMNAINSPTEGLCIYQSECNFVCCYTGSNWKVIHDSNTACECI